MNAVALGLGAALCWGTADVLARFATHALGAYRSLLYAQLAGLVALTAYAGATGELARVVAGASAGAWGWAVGAGVVFTGAALAFYRALETGVLALVPPITASYAALTVLLALASGETLTGSRAAGIAAALVGVALASIPRAAAPAAPPTAPPAAAARATAAPQLDRGVRWALVAAVGFALTFWLLGFRVTPAFGGVASVWVLRATGVVLLVGAARTVRAPLAVPRGRNWLLLAAVGALDTLAFVANNVGTTRGRVSVVSVLGSLFSAVTVLVAWGTLGERLDVRQWLGVALVLAGVALVST